MAEIKSDGEKLENRDNHNNPDEFLEEILNPRNSKDLDSGEIFEEEELAFDEELEEEFYEEISEIVNVETYSVSSPEEEALIFSQISEKIKVPEKVSKSSEASKKTETAPETPLYKKRVSYAVIPLLIAGLFSAASVIMAAVALSVSYSKTDLTILHGELYAEGDTVNKRFENLIRHELARKIPDAVRVKNVAVTVILNGADSSAYQSLSDIEDGDSVTVSAYLIPPESLREFAEDCRMILDAMLEVSKEKGISYDDVSFEAESNFAKMRVDFNGRFRMDITAEEIMRLTYYFGEFDDSEEDIEILEAPEELEEP